MPNQLGATRIEHIAHLERLADRVHKYGTKIFLQLQHPGREGDSSLIGGKQIVAPSPVMCRVTQQMPREMTTEECEALVKSFVTGAVIAQKAGFDGVEVHCAHGYILNEFLSPYTNKRTDRYGGSFDNRIRIVEEIIMSIRAVCGPNFIISVRISADEFVEGGLKIEDTIKIARVLESLGIDVINVSCGIYETSTTAIEPGSYPQGWKKHLAAAIRKSVKIPVIAVNNVKEPAVAAQLLEEGICDFVAVGRATLADPEWANKAKEGRDAEINRCIGCLNCFAALGEGRHICCTVNPRCGREVEYSDFMKNGAGRKVAIIGGGPAGMQAALVLKEREYAPIIFEKSGQLGGQLNIADMPILKDKLHAYKNSLISRIKHAGIEVRLNTAAAVKDVKALNPVGVFIATGGNPIIPNIPGLSQDNVMTAEEVLTGKKIATGKVAVIGGGITGMETAETLASREHEVILIEMANSIGNGVYDAVLADFIMRFEKFNITIMTSQKLLSVNGRDLQVINTATTEESTINADTIVLALGTSPNKTVIAEFEKEFENVVVLGDANKSGRILEAVFDGLSRAYTF